MNDHERRPSPECDATGCEVTMPQHRTVPEPPSHRRRQLLGMRLPVLAVLGIVAVPCIVAAVVNGLDRSPASALSPQSSQRPELSDADAEESGAATPGAEPPGSEESARQGQGATPRPTRSSDRGGRADGPEESRNGVGRKDKKPSSTPSPSGPNRPGESASSPPGRQPAPTENATVLKRGDSGTEVTAMQRKLYRLGFYHGHRYGHFDDVTEDSLRRFQTWAAVADEVVGDEQGTYGPATRDALERWDALVRRAS